MKIGFESVMRVCCQIKGELRRERVPTLTDMGLKETEQEQLEEQIEARGKKLLAPLPMHKRSDAE